MKQNDRKTYNNTLTKTHTYKIHTMIHTMTHTMTLTMIHTQTYTMTQTHTMTNTKCVEKTFFIGRTIFLYAKVNFQFNFACPVTDIMNVIGSRRRKSFIKESNS